MIDDTGPQETEDRHTERRKANTHRSHEPANTSVYTGRTGVALRSQLTWLTVAALPLHLKTTSVTEAVAKHGLFHS